jgi:XTP/dITP diphosphohydrolase
MDVNVMELGRHDEALSRLLLATSNMGKAQEMRDLLDPLGIEILTPSDLGLRLEVEEAGATFAENATSKAEAFSAASGLAAVADDSGLVVDALGGWPGVHSARFGGPGLDDADRVHRLLEAMRDVPRHQRAARFVSAIALSRPGKPTILFEGTVEGSVATEPRGSGGFGYDPVFLYSATGQTLAEMGHDAKSEVSHRGKAMRKLVDHLQGL